MRRRVRTGQVVVAEVAVVAVALSVLAPWWVLVGVTILAAAVLVATFGRAGGRWWFEAILLTRRFRRRRRLAAAQVLTAFTGSGAGVPAPVAWLRTLAPALSLRAVAGPAGPVGVASDEDGWFAVVEVGPRWGGPSPPPYRELAAVLEPGATPGVAPVSVVQLVVAAGPTPDQPRPAWVAVRISPVDALRAEQAGGVSAVERSVVAAAGRAVRALAACGFTARTVAPDDVVPALAAATGLQAPPQEHWSWWRTGHTVRTHYAVTGWTPVNGTVAVGVSQLAVRLARPDGADPLAAAAVVAVVAAAPEALARVCRGVVEGAKAQAVRLVRLDGEQALAVYASAPTAAPVLQVRA